MESQRAFLHQWQPAAFHGETVEQALTGETVEHTCMHMLKLWIIHYVFNMLKIMLVLLTTYCAENCASILCLSLGVGVGGVLCLAPADQCPPALRLRLLPRNVSLHEFLTYFVGKVKSIIKVVSNSNQVMYLC